MANLKLENGKLYRVEEVNSAEIEIKAQQLKNFVNDVNARKNIYKDQLANIEINYNNKISDLVKEKAKSQAAIIEAENVIKYCDQEIEKFKVSCQNDQASYISACDNCDLEIKNAVATLSDDDKEAIRLLYPETAKDLGF